MRNTLYKIALILAFSVLNIAFSIGNSNVKSKEDDTKLAVVVIDPGHGGKDPGAVVGKAREKEIVLDIALKLGNKIKTEFPDIKVIYTRSKDIFIPLHERAKIANQKGADLFISIHANAVNSKKVQGAETFVLGQHRSKDNLEIAKKENSVILLEEDYSTTYEGFDPNSPESYIMFELVQDEYLEQSVLFASSIQEEFKNKANRVDRSVKQAGFLVLRQTTMPSVLVEAGFLSHTAERNFLLKEAGKSQIASSIYAAFKSYKKKIEEKSSFHLVTEDEPKKNDLVRSPTKNKLPAAEIETHKKNETIANNKAEINKTVAIAKKQGTTKRVDTSIYFSVQVAASKKNMETTPSNFRGEKKIFKQNSTNLYRYFSGKFKKYDEALAEKTRLQSKFGGAFVVAFENENLISVKKALGKM